MIAGATATGKSGLAIELVARLARDGIRAEVISADSRQVFRGLDIGTAKVTAEERSAVPHHGLDLVEPDQPFSVADFMAAAEEALTGIAARGAVALLVGGTGLYLRAVGRGLDVERLPFDPRIRAAIEAEIARDGLDAVSARLAALAPRLASTVDLRNPRRVARAMEIAELVGDGERPQPRGYDGPSLWLGLALEESTHRAWIARRASEQFERGLIEEADLLRRRWDPSLPAFSAIGYREAWAILDGELSRDAALELNVTRNAAFARRQRTWFRSEPGIDWLDAADAPLAATSDRIRRFLDPVPVS